MKADQVKFRYSQQEGTMAWTEKASEYTQFAIKGVLWFDGSNTYHKAYISGLHTESNSWVDIGETVIHAGYGNQYLITGGEWLINNGFIVESIKTNGYCLTGWTAKEMAIEYYSQEVKRKRDM